MRLKTWFRGSRYQHEDGPAPGLVIGTRGENYQETWSKADSVVVLLCDMFQFVDIQENFPNLNDIDGFTKLFKKSPSAFAEARGSLVHNVWVLPGHILVSLNEGRQLLAYDILPKQTPWPNTHDFMVSSHTGRRKGQRHVVFEVFCVESAEVLYMFIVLKSAGVQVWKFVRPGFEWHFVTTFGLSVSKNVQVTSVCFDKKSRLLFWCERRTPTQCCVCKGKISIESVKDILVGKTDILHNCPPIHLFIVGSSGVLMHPTANSPVGLNLYWSTALNRIQLHLWNYLHNGIIPGYFSTDFQSLLTESISLWINQNPNDPTVIAYCTHPVTQELLVLESTCNLYSSIIDSNGKPVVTKLCTLCTSYIGEINPRKTCAIFAFKRFLGLIVEEHTLLVFETYTGRLVWQSDSSANERVKSWVSQGNIPQVGLWCLSFMKVIRSESIIKQAESLLKLDMQKSMPAQIRKISKEYTLHLTFKGNNGRSGKETYVVVDQEDGQKENPDSTAPTHQAIDSDQSHTISESVTLISEYLKDWDTKNLSYEVSLWLLNHPKLHGDTKWLQFRNREQFERFYSMFENPCIPLGLLHSNRRYKVAVDEMVNKLSERRGRRDMRCLGMVVQTLLDKYCSLSKDIEGILKKRQSRANGNLSTAEFPFSDSFRTQIMNESLTKQDLSDIIQWAAEIRPEEFIDEIVEILRLNPKMGDVIDSVSDQVSTPNGLETQLWRNILRKDTNSFEIICTKLWDHSPHFLVRFVKLAQSFATASESGGFLQVSRRPSLVSLAGITHRTVDSLSYSSCEQRIDADRLKVLVELKCLPETVYGMTETCRLMLENDLCGEAIDLLDSSTVPKSIYDRLFYMIISTLIEKGWLGRFSTRISEKIPPSFNAEDLCNLMKAFEDSTNSTDVFAFEGKTTVLSDLEPLFNILFKDKHDKIV